MHSEPAVKHDQSSSAAEGGMHKHLDREIREMVSAITHRVTDLHKSGSTHHLDDEKEHGVRIITIAGDNNGATLRSELEEKSGRSDDGEPEALSTHINSNFQAVNNSIMLGGSYQANDPGVHMDVSDFTEPHGHHKAGKRGKKGKKKGKEASKSDDHHSKHTD